MQNQSDALRLVEEMPKVYSEPFADSSQIPTTLLSILAKKYVTVALCGDGDMNYFLVTLDIFLRITHSNILLWDLI